MRKYNRLIAVSVVIYLLAALAVGYGTRLNRGGQGKAYKVEINRLYNSLSQGIPADKLDLRACKYVQRVHFLPASALYQEETALEFYREGNELRIEIRPLFKEGQLDGILRFDYREEEPDLDMGVLITQGCLGVMELLILAVLFYLKRQLIRPFQQLSRLPYELAQGHLKGIVRQDRSKYFGQFLWGIGQLKDQLDVTKKRELELEKEKKILLLSLSHDIKTPLNTIKLYGKALEEELYREEEKKKHAACQISEKAEEIERYVDEIMHNSREDILDIQVKEGEFYLDDLIKRVLESYREKCSMRMVCLEVGCYENRLLAGDIDHAMEVFENLFENAFKYGDGKKIVVTFYEEDYRQLIRVFNTGIPVSDNEFNHMFESFFRAGNSKGKQGHGLGLYICREIMRKMGGEIFAEKEENGMAFVLVMK